MHQFQFVKQSSQIQGEELSLEVISIYLNRTATDFFYTDIVGKWQMDQKIT